MSYRMKDRLTLVAKLTNFQFIIDNAISKYYILVRCINTRVLIYKSITLLSKLTTSETILLQ